MKLGLQKNMGKHISHGKRKFIVLLPCLKKFPLNFSALTQILAIFGHCLRFLRRFSFGCLLTNFGEVSGLIFSLVLGKQHYKRFAWKVN